MPDLIRVSTEHLSTAEFYEEIARIDHALDPPAIRAYSVDLDPISFMSMVSVGGVLETVAGADGMLSHVMEDPTALPGDRSASSRFFALHCDGIYLPRIPETVVLHCIDPGNNEIPTVFVDTQAVVEFLGEVGMLEEATAYVFTYTHRRSSKHTRPLIDVNPITGETMMTSVVPGESSWLHPREGSGKTQKDADEFSALLEQVVTSGVPSIKHTWEAKDTVVFNNLRFVHGRGLPEYKAVEKPDVRRHLLRIWLSRNSY